MRQLLSHLSWRPSRIGTLLSLVLLPTFIGLGVWQLQRADSKAAQFAQFETQAELPVLRELPAGHVPRYARASLAGRYVVNRQFLLDNMTDGGRGGYHVLTPFVPSGEERWLLVNRGWVPAPGDRRSLPDIAANTDTRVVTGQFDQLPRPGLDLGAPSAPGPERWPQVVSFPDMAALQERLAQRLFDQQLLLDPDQPDGFLRAWGPRSMAPERHLGYAVQWFALAAVLVILYATLSVRRARS